MSFEIENENGNWSVNHIWDNADGEPTQWVYKKDSEFPYYVDYIEASEQYEVTYTYRRLYASKNFESCVKFVERENESEKNI